MHPLVSLVKQTVETFILENKTPFLSENFPKEFLEKQAGVFVTIKKDGQLRGCIGTYLPTKKNIAEEIIANAIAAAIYDYRFNPIQKEELPYLIYEVNILTPPEFVTTKKVAEPLNNFFIRINQSNLLNPKKFGIIVKTIPLLNPSTTKEKRNNNHSLSKSGLLLPNLKGIDDIYQQILTVCLKASIDPNKENFLIYRFRTQEFV